MFKFKSKKWAIALLVVAGLIVLHYTYILRPVEDLFLSWTQPVAEKIFGAGTFIKTTYKEQFQKREQARTIEELRDKVNELTAENAKLKALKQENQKLRKYLDFWEEKQYDHVMANVVSREISDSPRGEEANIIIDKGENSGLKQGLIVVNSEGVVVGKIQDIKKNSARVVLITNNRSQIASTVQNSDRTTGVVKGEMGLTMKMDFIPRSQEIKKEDTVVTSGLEEKIPRGFVLGKVAQVKEGDNQVWQQAVIEPMVDFDDLTMISVLIPSS